MMTQNPKAMFSRDSIYDDLYEATKGYNDNDLKIADIVAEMNIEHILKSHPYDVSVGELQRAAFAKIMLCSPDIVLLDEPTKAVDAPQKRVIADIITAAKKRGVSFVIATHDLEFACDISDRCSMIFDGACCGDDLAVDFFDENHFYTTTVNRITRAIIPKCVTVEDVIKSAEVI